MHNKMIKVNLNGTWVGVVSGMIHDNLGNGLPTYGYVLENGETIYYFTTLNQYHDWWKGVYGDSDVGLDRKYILITCP
jgi:hypothetical protein